MFCLLVFKDIKLVNEGARRDPNERPASIFPHPATRTAFPTIDTVNGFKPQMRQVMH